MRERPILFSGPMVRAILDWRKTMTRRVMKPQPGDQASLWRSECEWESGECAFIDPQLDPPEYFLTCPYGVPGDRLWVRETWGYGNRTVGQKKPIHVEYRASRAWNDDGHEKPNAFCCDWGPDDPKRNFKAADDIWRPSIFMPRAFSRLALEVVSVRVERVQEITEADAISEGIGKFQEGYAYDDEGRGFHGVDPRVSFLHLWDSINFERGFGWDVNPWVWVVQFRRIK